MVPSVKKSLPFYLIFTAVAALSLFTSLCLAELPRFQLPEPDRFMISFLAVGDWGRKGEYRQIQVAHQMGLIGELKKIKLVISTGDNFYRDGLKNLHDPAFKESYIKIYTAKSLMNIPWYIILGNRDYRGNVQAQLLLNQRDSRWHCHRSYVVGAGVVEFFFIDTTPLVDKYFKDDANTDRYQYDWKDIKPREDYILNLQKDLVLALRHSKAKWKIAVGHHTIRSAGETGTTAELERDILPILEKYKVDIYINGHDHCLQYVIDTKSGIHFITSGSGAKASKKTSVLKSEHELKYFYDGEGFVSMQITPSKAEFVFHHADGESSETFSVAKIDAKIDAASHM